jgi:hypothetical protein
MDRYLTLFLSFLAILALGFITGLVNYKRKPTLRPVVVLLGVTLLSEICSYLLAKYYRNNMPLAHFFNPVQMLIWAYFFYNNFREGYMKNTVKWVVAGMLIFAACNTLFFQPLKTFPDNFIKLETMLFIVWAAYLFIQQLDIPAEINIFKSSLFIVSVAVLWFNLMSFLFFLLYAYMVSYGLSTTNINTMHYFSNYFYYILLFIAVALPQKNISNAGRIQQ